MKGSFISINPANGIKYNFLGCFRDNHQCKCPVVFFEHPLTIIGPLSCLA